MRPRRDSGPTQDPQPRRGGGLGGFLRAFATVAFGTVGGQVAMALSAPILSRIYLPADYGVSGLVIALATVSMAVATLRYDVVIITSRSASARANAVGLTAVLILGYVAAMALVIACVIGWSAMRSSVGPEQAALISPILLLAPLMVLATGAETILQNLLIVGRAFRRVALGGLGNGLTTGAGQIGLGLAGFGPWGLVIGRLSGHLVAIAVLLAPRGMAALRTLWPKIDRGSMLRVARANRRQALFQAPANALSIVAGQIPVFMLAPLAGAAAAGSYYFINALAMSGLQFFTANAPGMVLREGVRRRQAGQRLLPFVIQVTLLVGAPAFALAAALWFHAPLVVTTIFGAEWRDAGEILRYTGFFYAALPMFLPSGAMSQILRTQHVNMMVQGLRVAGAFGAMLWGAARLDHMAAIQALVASNVAAYVVGMAVIMLAIAADDRRRRD